MYFASIGVINIDNQLERMTKYKTSTTNLSKLALMFGIHQDKKIFRILVPVFLRDTNVALIVYDVTSKKSFCELQEWYLLFENNIENSTTKFLIGNTIGVKEYQIIDENKGKEFTDSHDTYFRQTMLKLVKE
jgi:GTPase SAR1 family protein